jgi:serine/threonine protein kinase
MRNDSRAVSLFEQAIDIDDCDERLRFLESACLGDPRLLREVQTLLDSDRSASTNSFWRSSALAVEARLEGEDPEDRSGERLGPYRLECAIASGGMGTVYRAVRDDEAYRQLVAIKVIKRGMDTGAIIRRFRNERQILAGLEHPNIARLLDGGATPDGLPYLVMEYVDGAPIDQYAAREGLCTAQRLRLFLPICAAVEFAHQNLVVHQDIKPGNILVDSNGVPKLLDFGIAKLVTASQSGDGTMARAPFLTPDYASPEQVAGESVTTVSDIYSLGVLLYRLLTGLRPYQVKTGSQEELLEAIRSQHPPRPSTLAARLDAKAGEADPKSLNKKLRGDLDNIVLMAMRKEPARRYASAGALAADIQAHLDSFPVKAHRDSRLYRIRKFTTRHRVAVAAAVLFTVFLIAFSVALSLEIRVARRQEIRADRRSAEVRQLASSLVADVTDSLARLPGTLETRQRLLARALSYLDGLANGRGNDAELRLQLAQTYLRLGEMSFREDVAASANKKALALSQALVAESPRNPDYHEALAAVYNRMAALSRETGQIRESLNWLQRSTGEVQQAARLRPGLESDVKLAESLSEETLPLSLLGNTDEAIQKTNQALVLLEPDLRRRPGDAELQRQAVINHLNLARLYMEEGDWNAATREDQRSLDATSALQRGRAEDAHYLRDLWVGRRRMGNILERQGRLEPALAQYDAALALIEPLAAADSGDSGHQRGVALSLTDRSRALSLLSMHSAALAGLTRAIRITDRRAQDNPALIEAKEDLAETYLEYARALRRSGRNAESSEAYRHALLLFIETTRIDRENAGLVRDYSLAQAESR